LGYHPLSFVDDVLGATRDYCADAVDGVEQVLMNEPSLQGKEQFVNMDCNNLNILLNDAFDQSFDRFELYLLNNIFSIPKDVSLSDSHDEPPLPQHKEDEHKLDEEINTLRAKIKRVQASKEEMKVRVEEMDKAIAFISSVKKNLIQSNEESSIGEWGKDLKESLEQLKKLVDISNNKR